MYLELIPRNKTIEGAIFIVLVLNTLFALNEIKLGYVLKRMV